VERKQLADGVRVIVSSVLERAGYLAAFTERAGGESAPPRDSLNLGSHVGDDPAAVTANRRRVASALGLPAFAVLRQVHGSHVVDLDQVAPDPGHPEAVAAEADAAVVGPAGPPVAILTADCVPLAVVAPADGRVVAVHAGWRGLAAGIVERAVELLGRADDLVAAIGPAIGPCHYEVGEEVVAAVGPPAIVERRDGSTFLDLPGTVAGILSRAGVPTIDRAAECTACEPARFFSHRRDGVTGRQAMVVARR
jgi:hypothetical protein